MTVTTNTLYGTLDNSTLPYISGYGVCNNTKYGVIPDPYKAGFDPNAPWNMAVNSPTFGSDGYQGVWVSSLNKFFCGGTYDNPLLQTSNFKDYTISAPTGLTTPLNGIIWTGTQFIGCGESGYIATSPDGTTWTTRTSGTTNTLYRLAYSGSIIVAVGANNTIRTSSDGVTWTTRTSGISGGMTTDIFGVAWTGSKFVAAGPVDDNEYAVFAISTDGITWTPVTTTIAQYPSDITWDGSKLSVVGLVSSYLTSTNGTSWTESSLPVGAQAVVSNGSRIVAVGSVGTILTSTNGVTWTTVSIGLGSDDFRSITWAGDRFVVTSVAGIGGLLWSYDGLIWYAGFADRRGSSGYQLGYNSAENSYIVLGYGDILKSTDKQKWRFTNTNKSASNVYYSCTYASQLGLWVAAGSGGLLSTSTDGITWTSRTSTVTSTINSICWTGTKFFAVTGTTSNNLITSTNGTTWSATTLATSAFNGIAYNDSVLVAVGANGVIYTSPDGTTWTSRTSGTTNALQNVCWTGTQFIAVGASGTILTSPTGTTWTSRTSGTTNALYCVDALSGSYIYAVGAFGTIKRSLNGVTWTSETSPFGTIGLYSVNCKGTSVVVAGRFAAGNGRLSIMYK